MRLTTVMGVCVVLLVLGSVPGAYALQLEGPSSSFAGPFPGPSLLDRETAVLVQRGASLARATESMTVLGVVSHLHLLRRLLARLASAYAGVWFEPADAALHVAVASRRGKLAAERLSREARLGSHMIVTLTSHSWSRLLAVQARWDRRLRRLLERDEAQTATNPQRNMVVITYASTVPLRRRAMLMHAAGADAAMSTVRSSHAPRLGIADEIRETKCNLFVTRRAYCEKPLTPGVTIEGEKLAGKCTAGPLVMPKNDKNRTYVLTAGHCLQFVVNFPGAEARPKWYAFNTKGERAEIGRTTEYYNNANVDVGAIRVNIPGKWGLEGNPPVYALTAEWKRNEEKSFPVKGKELPLLNGPNCTEGQTSGAVCGTIKEFPVTSGSANTKGLVETEPEAGRNTNRGDSGAPVIKETKGEYLIEGVHKGKNLAFTHPVYEPIETALSELTRLKPELVTTINEERPKESAEEKTVNEKLEKEEKEEKEGVFKETAAEKEAAEKEVTKLNEEAEKEGNPLILAAPTPSAPLTFSATSGTSTLEAGETKIECKESSESGEFYETREGVVTLDLHGCKSLGVGCNSTGDAAETVLVAGNTALVDLEKGKLVLGFSIAIGEVQVECAKLVSALLRGSVIGEVTGVESGKKTKAATIVYKQEKGKQTIKECHLTKLFCEAVKFLLEASIGGGAFKEAGFASEEKVTLGKEVSFDF